jgi:hypothetical protein
MSYSRNLGYASTARFDGLSVTIRNKDPFYDTGISPREEFILRGVRNSFANNNFNPLDVNLLQAPTPLPIPCPIDEPEGL